jgi:putative transposase
MEYQHKNTSVSIVNYHIIFCPKYGRGLLVGKIKMRLEKIIRDIALENSWEVIAKEIMPDHVHLFVGAYTRTPPEIVVKRFKWRSRTTMG